MTDKTIHRWQSEVIKNALETRRILVLVGARQCGKTTLVQRLAFTNSRNLEIHFNKQGFSYGGGSGSGAGYGDGSGYGGESSNHIYRTLDDITLFEAARNDPVGFVKHGDELMIIDEVQRVPELLSAVKQDVDHNQKAGRFLLTGSANIQSLPNVSESLAGRVRKIRLRPLTLGEIKGISPNFITQAFQENFSKNDHVNSKDDYLVYALQGGYPEARNFNDKERYIWHKDYLEALIERDLKDIVNIRRKDSMVKLLETLAAWSSKFIDISAISSCLSITRPTIESYINALETLYLVERVRPWSKTDYARVNKQDKLFVTDTGLMSSILKWNIDKIRLNSDLNGKLIETFVFNQLATLVDIDSYNLYHYRDREKREVDFIVENNNGDILAIEVKSGSKVTKDNFKHLKWFKANVAKDEDFTGIVLYTGKEAVRFGEKMWVVPINSIWA